MLWLTAVMALALMGVVGMGVYYELRPEASAQGSPRWMRGVVGANLMLFAGGLAGLLLMAAGEASAAAGAAGGGGGEVSVGLGLALIGIGIPTALSTVGAGIAVGPVGASALAVISEKPEMFGRTLIYLGLAEGIAIYGLVVTILLLGQI
jgi:V/A-type H+-transporting ATPase subunit K